MVICLQWLQMFCIRFRWPLAPVKSRIVYLSGAGLPRLLNGCSVILVDKISCDASVRTVQQYSCTEMASAQCTARDLPALISTYLYHVASTCIGWKLSSKLQLSGWQPLYVQQIQTDNTTEMKQQRVARNKHIPN